MGQIVKEINSHFTPAPQRPSRAVGERSSLGAAGAHATPETLCNCASLKSR